MYSMVLMMALSGSGETLDFGRRGGGCCGCFGGGYAPISYGWSYGCGGGMPYVPCGWYGGYVVILPECVVVDEPQENKGSQRTAEEEAQLKELLTNLADDPEVQKQVEDYYNNPDVSNEEWTEFYNKQKKEQPAKEERTTDDRAKLDELLKTHADDAKAQKEIKAYYDNPNVSNAEWREFYKKETSMKESRRDENGLSAPATILIGLPKDAKVSFDGAATTSTSGTRSFESPVLSPGKEYVYTVTAKFLQNAKLVTVTKDVSVRAGRTSIVTFTAPAPDVVRR